MMYSKAAPVTTLLVLQVIADATSIPGTSMMARELLAKATPVSGDTTPRFLKDGEMMMGWMADYSIQFQGCHTLIQFGEERNNQEGGQSALVAQHLARFRFCKKGHCNKSNQCYGDYLTGLQEFVNGYTEFKMEIEVQKCENVRENCNCEYANDDEVCENQCYTDAGLENCIQIQDDYEEDFEIQRYLECKEMEAGNDDGAQYFIGPTCSSNGKHVYLSVFQDASCTVPAPEGTYEKYNYYGKSLPYSTESLISNDCIDCEQVDDENNAQNNYNGNQNNYNNYYYDDREVAEVCARSYEESAKCEKGMNGISPYPRVYDCKFVQHTVYMRDEESPKGQAEAFAFVFAITFFALLFYVYKLRKSISENPASNDASFVSNANGETSDGASPMMIPNPIPAGQAKLKNFLNWRKKKHGAPEGADSSEYTGGAMS
mmetsp:Transcript_12918/g.19667  ORF Transcript_12918/g.19667 Transcript_12918/m.19667 type:complete len:431 (-) Transcript_12918:142-1434(-)